MFRPSLEPIPARIEALRLPPPDSSVMPMMHISYLADHEHLIPDLARLHFGEWSYLRPGETLEGRTERLRGCCGKDLPTVVVGTVDDELCGSAMLVAHDLEDRRELTPWLAGVYVKPEFRGRGLAALLIERIAQQARALHFPRLYLYTPGNERMYEHLGWFALEHRIHQGTGIVVMSRPLG
ncbi:MAG TPA: GNAT family N-acetyltransferase [Xanthomonadaceae bacterium]|nr:GNAT family N-acetyltransferase [Xanthomonadaceae bacterium]